MPEETPQKNLTEHPPFAVLPFPLDQNTRFALKKGGFILSGTAVLASGTVTVSDQRIQTGSVPLISYVTPGGTTGTNLKAVVAQGSLTITAVNTSGTAVTTDTSTVSFLIVL